MMSKYELREMNMSVLDEIYDVKQKNILVSASHV